MTKKKKPEKNNHKAVNVACRNEEEKAALTAQTYLRPSVLSAVTIKEYYQNDDDLKIYALIDELSKQIDRVNKGDMGRPEAMLMAQAHTLDSLFVELVNRSRLNMGEYFNAADKYMRLALKAQSQCRTTLETLSEIKNPKPYIQNNRAQYQQVNNGTHPDSHKDPRAGNSKSTNELLEDQTNDPKRMDPGTPQKTSRIDQTLAAMEAQHRAEDT